MQVRVILFFMFQITLLALSVPASTQSINPMATSTPTLQKVVHRANTRGQADFGWLKANYSFSFSSWYDPNRMGFGALRVLNDDEIAPGRGFGTHPHDNMEIITVPFEGALAHRDNTGGEGVIRNGEVQVMSAGTGIQHSEFNASKDEAAKLCQIWILPKMRNVTPRYDQKAFPQTGYTGKFQTLVSNDGREGSLSIHQDAFISRGHFEPDATTTYDVKKPGNGVYAFVIQGGLVVAGESLGKRDAIGLAGNLHYEMNFPEKSDVLIIEVPMQP